MNTCKVCGKITASNRFVCFDERCEKQWRDIGYDTYKSGSVRSEPL